MICGRGIVIARPSTALDYVEASNCFPFYWSLKSRLTEILLDSAYGPSGVGVWWA